MIACVQVCAGLSLAYECVHKEGVRVRIHNLCAQICARAARA